MKETPNKIVEIVRHAANVLRLPWGSIVSVNLLLCLAVSQCWYDLSEINATMFLYFFISVLISFCRIANSGCLMLNAWNSF